MLRYLRIGTAALFMVGVGLVFAGINIDSTILHWQLGPALLRLATMFSLGTLAVVLTITLLTVLFGRFYCSVFCPLGIMQDIISFPARRQGKTTANYAKIRYGIAGVAFGLLLGGWSTGFLLLEPYSNFGRIITIFSLGSILPLVIIVVLAIWKQRVYCTTICPVGTLLGLLSKYGIFRLKITDKCKHCGQCIKTCPAGCIDAATGVLDNERCVRCMNCVSACRLKAIEYGRSTPKTVPINETRRAFMINGSLLLATLAGGALLAKSGMSRLADWAKELKILPPGAGSTEKFIAKCTACQLCVARCPAKIIKPSAKGFGPVALDMSKNFCHFNCRECSKVCPTGAIKPLSLNEKQHCRIAEVVFKPTTCIVFQEGTACGLCAKGCPTGAITLRKNGTPKVNQARCIGCGACQNVCPATAKAMTIKAVEQQTII